MAMALLCPPSTETLTLSRLKPNTHYLYNCNRSRRSLRPQFPQFPRRQFRAAAATSKPPLGSSSTSNQRNSAFETSEGSSGGLDLGWLRAFPHVLMVSMANFLFGYHIGGMNGPIEAIARDLGFGGDPFLEGLVVSIFIVGAFIGSMSSASLINRLGCRHCLQIDMIPLIVGALISAQAHSLDEILRGRFLVGLGIGT